MADSNNSLTSVQFLCCLRPYFDVVINTYLDLRVFFSFKYKIPVFTVVYRCATRKGLSDHMAYVYLDRNRSTKQTDTHLGH